MKKASTRLCDAKVFPFVGEDPTMVQSQTRVAEVFSYLQDRRHLADYDISRHWTQTEALSEVETAAEAFSAWQAIRQEKIAQDYLVFLLIKPRG